MNRERPAPQVETIRLGGRVVPYVVRRSPRAKYARITISAQDGVVVTLPARLQRWENPETLLREKQEWILKHLERIPVVARERPPLRDGSQIMLRGRPRTLRLIPSDPPLRFALQGDELRASLPTGESVDLRAELKRWLIEQARRVIVRTALAEAERIGVSYRAITIRDQKTKWGSCSRKGSLSFNWRLILFPPEVLRYVVVHELCHLRHFNHSERFWRLVAEHDHHYRRSVEWLRTHGVHLGVEYT